MVLVPRLSLYKMVLVPRWSLYKMVLVPRWSLYKMVLVPRLSFWNYFSNKNHNCIHFHTSATKHPYYPSIYKWPETVWFFENLKRSSNIAVAVNYIESLITGSVKQNNPVSLQQLKTFLFFSRAPIVRGVMIEKISDLNLSFRSAGISSVIYLIGRRCNYNKWRDLIGRQMQL